VACSAILRRYQSCAPCFVIPSASPISVQVRLAVAIL
jgi:hypothetical protein